ncbi:MAG: hypothetical protein ACRENP_15075 [Longimicrobiales bacterium]
MRFSILPALVRGAGTTVGLRYSLDVPAHRLYTTAAGLPAALRWSADLSGAAALKSRAATEPLLRGAGAVGFRILLERTGGCPPGGACVSTRRFGYVLVGARVAGELGQKAEEAEGALGAAIAYRSLVNPTGLWPLVPSLSAAYTISKPLRSALRDSLDAGLDAHRKLELAAIWNIGFAHEGLPDWFSRLHFQAEWRRFSEQGVPAAVDSVTRTHGTYLGAGGAYEITGLIPYVREFAVHWSQGEHATQKQRRKAWLIGVTIGTAR